MLCSFLMLLCSHLSLCHLVLFSLCRRALLLLFSPFYVIVLYSHPVLVSLCSILNLSLCHLALFLLSLCHVTVLTLPCVIVLFSFFVMPCCAVFMLFLCHLDLLSRCFLVTVGWHSGLPTIPARDQHFTSSDCCHCAKHENSWQGRICPGRTIFWTFLQEMEMCHNKKVLLDH